MLSKIASCKRAIPSFAALNSKRQLVTKQQMFKMVLQRGIMTKNYQQTTSSMIRASLLCPPQIRNFSDAEGAPQQERTGPIIDERVPRLMKNKILLLGIPAGVTKDDIREAFKEFEINEEQFNYQSQEETKDERGGRAFFDVGSVELGEQLVEKHG